MGKGKTLYIVLIVIALATLLPWPFVAYTSLFAFDAPGSDKDPATLAMTVPIWIYPVILLGSAGISWLMYRRKKLNLAIVLACIPLALIILYVAAAAIYFSKNA
ncbi:MAG: hypothetical protein EHM12_05125 [Dehalococcoidia bacterium]|nr:MAG: hypothetical protein EHM12_05125 [Dehalococcoidia bacterium]